MTEQNVAEGQQPEEQGQQPASQAPAAQQVRDERNTLQGQQAHEDSEPMVPERVMREREAENKKLRDRLKKIDDEQKKREEAEKTELERISGEAEGLREQNSALQKQLRRFYFNEQINVPNSRWAWAAAQDAGIVIEFGEDQQPTNLDDVRKQLKKLDPSLFGTAGKADAGERSQEQVQQANGMEGFMSDLLFNNQR